MFYKRSCLFTKSNCFFRSIVAVFITPFLHSSWEWFHRFCDMPVISTKHFFLLVRFFTCFHYLLFGYLVSWFSALFLHSMLGFNRLVSLYFVVQQYNSSGYNSRMEHSVRFLEVCSPTALTSSSFPKFSTICKLPFSSIPFLILDILSLWYKLCLSLRPTKYL